MSRAQVRSDSPIAGSMADMPSKVTQTCGKLWLTYPTCSIQHVEGDAPIGAPWSGSIS